MSSSPGGKASLFEEIVGLGVGESRVFAPGAFVRMNWMEKPERLGSGMIHMKTRARAGIDGGVSVMAGEETGCGGHSLAE